MTTYRAIPGADIRVGMTVSLKPGEKPFKVTRIEDSEVSERLVFIYGEGREDRAEGATSTNQWYAEVPS